MLADCIVSDRCMTVRNPRVEKSMQSDCQVTSMLVVIVLVVGVLDDEVVVGDVDDEYVKLIEQS